MSVTNDGATCGRAGDGPMPCTLYHCRDTRSFRVLWALEEAGLAYALVKMPFPPRFEHPGYLDINPLGTVPAFACGDTIMTESAAICQFIAEQSDLGLGVEPSEVAYPAYLDWLHRSDATLTFPLTLVLRYSRFEPAERRQSQIVADYTRWFLKRGEAVERALADHDHLCGDRFTVADICVAYAFKLARGLQLGVQFGSRTQEWLDRLEARPAYLRAEDAQADMAEVI